MRSCWIETPTPECSRRGSGGNIFGYQLAFSGLPEVFEIHRIYFEVALPDIAGSELTDTLGLIVNPSAGGQVSVRSLEEINVNAVLELVDGQSTQTLFWDFPGSVGEIPINGQIIVAEMSFAGGKHIDVEDLVGESQPQAIIGIALLGTHETSFVPPFDFEGTLGLRGGAGDLPEAIASVGSGTGIFGYNLEFTSSEPVMSFTSVSLRARLPVIPGATLNDPVRLVVTPADGQTVTIGSSVKSQAATWGEVKSQFNQ